MAPKKTAISYHRSMVARVGHVYVSSFQPALLGVDSHRVQRYENISLHPCRDRGVLVVHSGTGCRHRWLEVYKSARLGFKKIAGLISSSVDASFSKPPFITSLRRDDLPLR